VQFVEFVDSEGFKVSELGDNVDVSAVDQIVARIGGQPHRVIPILQAIQARYRYLPAAAMERLCSISRITPAQVAGVASFYTAFRLTPVGEHVIAVCHGTACHVAGAQGLSDALARHLELAPGADTDADGRFTVTKVACVGCCSLAPVMVVDGITYGHLAGETACQCLDAFLKDEAAGRHARADRHADPATRTVIDAQGGEAIEVRVGLNSCCMASGSLAVKREIEAIARQRGGRVVIKPVGCVGMCHRVPLVEVVRGGGGTEGGEPASSLYSRIVPYTAAEITRSHLRPRGPWRKLAAAARRAVNLLTDDRAWRPVERHNITCDAAAYHAFMHRQKHVVTEGYGRLDPLDLDEYIATGGYEALKKCQTAWSGQEIIEQVAASGLRGRGGAGFPTGRKWAAVRAAPGETKYVICNGDEGDPGAFMDRMLLEAYPHRIIEGMAVAAAAVGASEGHLYIRAEYPLAVIRVRAALEQARQRGLLKGPRFGSTGELALDVMEGAGAFVCGEETGLIASIEGRRGMPRVRPPFPAQRGLWGKPTSINNVETYACLPWILRNGPAAFAALGTEGSRGTKVFALAGRVRRVGLIEVPMGITIRQIVEEVGGGVREGHRFKAVQIGGPSGGCIPQRLADTPVDFEALTGLGAIMGSGGLVALDDGDCMVDIARYFLQFTQDQSCGRCTFCRVGTKRMLEVLDRICDGRGRAEDLAELEELADRVKRTSLCGLGSTAPNPVLTTLRYFREEYEAHLSGRCPAGVCKALISYRITDDCYGCTLCSRNCPADAIPARPYEVHQIDQEKCIRCGGCKAICPAEAVVIESPPIAAAKAIGATPLP
jgi:NADH-quinone oxidoreductase subunit F